MNTLHKLFSKETRVGRTVRGALQLAATILTFFLGLLAVPGVSDFVTQNWAITASSFITLNAVITYVYNAVESLLEYLGE